MKRENLDFLESEEIERVMSLYGKAIAKKDSEIDEYKNTIDDLKKQIESLPKTDELENLKNRIADYESKENERLAKEQASQKEAIILKNIDEAISDKKFVNEYTKNSIINEVKTALLDEANTGKSAKDLFETITKDKSDIFINPNQQIDMPAVENMDTAISKEAFNKMSYNERVELKQTNPELFRKYNE